jgi:hypothetical protein
MVINNVTILQEIEATAAFVSLRSDNIIHITFKPIEDFTIDNALEIFEAVYIIGKGKKFPTLISINKYMNIESDVRKLWAASSVNKYSYAEAMVLNNIANKLIGNFYIQINKPTVPTQIFTQEKEAIEWLREFK